MNNEDRNAIEQLAARFFEHSLDLMAVSSAITEVIEARRHLISLGVMRTERRIRPRAAGTLKRILDITYTQIRKTESENEQTRKGD